MPHIGFPYHCEERSDVATLQVFSLVSKRYLRKQEKSPRASCIEFKGWMYIETYCSDTGRG